ncbi:hypothetical protein HZA57_02595 [Candidatus Poribacteria bacterium]|nr:hypothetical protein [Candidatus Poribacteria bacterium]
MEQPINQMEKIAESKHQRRRRLALLSVPEKVRIIVRMQERRAPILRMRGEKQIVWRLDSDPPESSPRD